MNKRVGSNREFAAAALRESSEHKTVGEFLRAVEESDGSVSYFFEANHKGYEGWEWCVTLFEAADQPTVSELILLPSEAALLAPAWVPWSERLAEWKAMQAELEAQATELEAENEADSDSTSLSDPDVADIEDSNWADASDSFDEAEDLATQELRVIKEVSFAVSDETSNDDSEEVDSKDSALSDLEEGVDSETDSDDAGKRPPSSSRRNRFWGKKKNK